MLDNVIRLSRVIVSAIAAFALISLSALTSCSDSTHPQKIYNLNKVMASGDEEEFENVFDSIPIVKYTYLSYIGYDSAATCGLTPLLESKMVRMFVPAVDSVWPTLAPLEKQLGYVLEQSEKSGLDLPTRTYAAAVWGKPNSVIVNDSVLIMGMNYYLGADHPAYSGWPAYQRSMRQPDFLIYDIVEAMIGSRYPFESTDDDNVDLFTEMLYRGALVRLKMELVQDSEPSEALGWSKDQYEWAELKESEIWRKIVSDNMLYSKSPLLKSQLLNPSPGTTVISPEAPPRIGVYIGYKIVESYMDNNEDTSLTYILSPGFYLSQQSLVNSGYDPGS